MKWYAWDMDGFIVHYEKENNYKNEIDFKSKKDVLWQASCNYEDGRKIVNNELVLLVQYNKINE